MTGFAENIVTGEKMNISVFAGITANSEVTGTITIAAIITTGQRLIALQEEGHINAERLTLNA